MKTPIRRKMLVFVTVLILLTTLPLLEINRADNTDHNVKDIVTGTDSDGDGLPDSWEDKYNNSYLNKLDPDSDGDGITDDLEDYDLDGLNNQQEYSRSTSPLNWDTDGDGMADGWEVDNNLSPNYDESKEDNDMDQLTNYEEYMYGHNQTGIYFYGLDPNDPDTDDDGMPDRWEIQNSLNPKDNGTGSNEPGHEGEYINHDGVWVPADIDNGSSGDKDGDFLTNIEEYNSSTKPDDIDTDNDGMDDLWEIVHQQMPTYNDKNWDLDNDGLVNIEEYNNRTDPNEMDTDADGLQDKWEVDYGLDPLDDGVNKTEWNRTNRSYVIVHSGDIDSGPDGDPDHDNLINLDEYRHGTSPINNDSDGDGMPDYWELNNSLSPLYAGDKDEDKDGDLMSNIDEYLTGTEPDIADTDGDGVIDGEDDFPLDPDEWIDTDGDGQGDNSDPDDDGDGVIDEEDDFPLDPDEWIDTDGDGQGDNSDPDDDGDGVIDEEDDFPLDPDEWIDTDGDGLPDVYEEEHGLDPMDPDDADEDADDDGLTNVEEYNEDTDPNNADTDGDGIPDGEDKKPLEAEIDGDEGLPIWIFALIGVMIVIVGGAVLFMKKKEIPSEESEEEQKEPDEEE